ncbi:GNAT family N-acetyltransferase [Dongia rigui]|uniref:GNAT family N-acetyltransferase n=1 Tax=Dongia rigui TaxID=940149 RepID=A0ABU5DSD6_9PROT|nr:GNAT family N-acetyltransferase [Dongia rigui]
MVTLDTLIGFCAAHPVPETDAPRILARLNSGPAAIIDWRERGVVAVILDTIIGVNGVVPFEVVGLADGRMNGSLATDLLAELAARATKLGARSNELAMTPIWQPHRAAIEAAGYRHYYSDYDMSCRNPAWGPDLPLPPGAAWHDAWPDWADVYIDVLTTGFADVPGAFVPKPEEIRRYLQQSGIKARILIENGKGIGLLRYTEPNTYINAVVRAGDQKGRRIGQMVMDEARRCLVRQAENDAPMTLTVVDKNTAAIELYRRCNFDIDREVAVLIRHF